MYFKNHHKNITVSSALLIICFLGFLLRIYRLQELPPGFFADEASIGYNAYTLLTNLSDEEGRKLPIFFKNFGDFYRPGLSVYLTTPFVAVFGLNELSVRLSAAIIGSLSILVMFFLTKEMFSSRLIALFSSLILAFSPWHIHMSRIGQEFIYLPFFAMLSTFLFLRGLNSKKYYLFLLSFVSFGLTLYTYVTAYFIVPFLLLPLIFIYRKDSISMKKNTILGLLIIFTMSIPLITGIPSGKTFSRFKQVSTINTEKSKSEVLNQTLRTYLDHFSPSFLFLDGDIDYKGHFITRFSVKGMGELYLFQLPLIIAGLVALIRHYNKSSALVFLFLATYPLGSTFAPFADGGGPFAMRSVLGTIPFTILTSVGFYKILDLFKNDYIKFIFTAICIATILASLNLFLYKYHKEYPLYAADYWGWQYGTKPIITTFLEKRDYYDELIMEGQFNAPDIHIKFRDPSNICESKCKVGGIDYYNEDKKQLFALSPETAIEINSNYNFNIRKTVYYPEGNTPAFLIGEVNKK